MPVRFALPPRGWAAAVRCALGQHKIAAGASPAGLALAVAAAVTGGARSSSWRRGARAGLHPACPRPSRRACLPRRLRGPAGRGQLLRLLVRALQEGDPAAGQVLPHPERTDRHDRRRRQRRRCLGAPLRAHGRGDLPVGVDRTAAAATAWGVVALPQTFFLDAGRHVIERVFGAVTPAELTRDTAQLAGTPGPRATGSPAGPAG